MKKLKFHHQEDSFFRAVSIKESDLTQFLNQPVESAVQKLSNFDPKTIRCLSTLLAIIWIDEVHSRLRSQRLLFGNPLTALAYFLVDLNFSEALSAEKKSRSVEEIEFFLLKKMKKFDKETRKITFQNLFQLVRDTSSMLQELYEKERASTKQKPSMTLH